ncbi:HSP18 transcriptional regulator [Streptomyces flavovirens]|uniref:HSP18 transcriptional regulator n=1 Tax=Streptomyces TaxID=1883 RepID=UPI00081AF7A2|nr:HSP18 transcriptional regulator [Streptomyces sp. BpilaLS-43]MYU34092.1 HSP18 transcriptional regulator [Streptomyces sp. SID8358]SCD70705.1 hypothetical protein GA0115239_106214 [Streptomyces sp. BpilaLS-43]
MTGTATPGPPDGPASFEAAVEALRRIDGAVRDAIGENGADATPPHAGAEQALAALLLLREVRHRLAGWETGLIETARGAGASWADLAEPLGVASRQAAERRYLRLRPGADGTTGEERVQATRDRRAAGRSVSAWARDNAAHLRSLAGRISALPDLSPGARSAVDDLTDALAGDDAAGLVAPLTGTRPHLDRHPELAAGVDALARHTEQLRRDSTDQRREKA